MGNYNPFGMVMPNANNLGAGTYRYGMNGMEQDKEVKGGGNSYTSHFRQYDPRLGRWMSDEPKPVAYESGYAAFRNNPIYFTDPLGDFPNIGGMLKSIGNFFKGIGKKIGKAFKGKAKEGSVVKGGFNGYEKICDGCGSATNPINMETFAVTSKSPPGLFSKFGNSVLKLAVQAENFTNSFKGSRFVSFGIEFTDGPGGTNTDGALVNRWNFDNIWEINQQDFEDVSLINSVLQPIPDLNNKSKLNAATNEARNTGAVNNPKHIGAGGIGNHNADTPEPALGKVCAKGIQRDIHNQKVTRTDTTITKDGQVHVEHYFQDGWSAGSETFPKPK
jgi:RHS repeat-associated protein